MALSKMIYFSGDLFERATEGTEKGDVSRRINELIEKGLRFEEKGDKMSLKSLIMALVRVYNIQKPNDKITL